MRGGVSRDRSVDAENEIPTLFQGENEHTGYLGDSKIRGSSLTIQIHNLRILDAGKNEIALNVPTIAVWIPSDMAQGWLVQQENQA
jgi:hypothetical protein